MTDNNLHNRKSKFGLTSKAPGGYGNMTKKGTRLILDSRGNYRLEHIIVWEAHYGPLKPGQFLIHKNGDKLDNRIENLEIKL